MMILASVPMPRALMAALLSGEYPAFERSTFRRVLKGRARTTLSTVTCWAFALEGEGVGPVAVGHHGHESLPRLDRSRGQLVNQAIDDLVVAPGDVIKLVGARRVGEGRVLALNPGPLAVVVPEDHRQVQRGLVCRLPPVLIDPALRAARPPLPPPSARH